MELAQLGRMTLKDLVNPKSQAYKRLKPDLSAMNERDIIAMINSEPRILRRPIITNGNQLAIGFSEGTYQEMLS